MADSEAQEKDGERIAKVMARAGLCSRRDAEAWIAQGRVAVNGAAIASPALNVTARDRITVDGKPLPQRERTRLFLYHKPRNLVTTHADPQGRPTIFEGLPKDLPRLVSVGRLDFTTEGLLLLTNDGGLARVLELPATGWLRRYRVRAHGETTQPELDRLRGGITVDGLRYGAIEATLDRVQGSNLWLTFSIREGKNREVRNVLRHLGLDVNRLIRVSFGPFQLGDLDAGAVEEVKTRVLREQLGDKLAKAAGADFESPAGERDTAPAKPAAGPGRPPRIPRPARAGEHKSAAGERKKSTRERKESASERKAARNPLKSGTYKGETRKTGARKTSTSKTSTSKTGTSKAGARSGGDAPRKRGDIRHAPSPGARRDGPAGRGPKRR